MSKPSSQLSKVKEQDAPYDLDALARERSKKNYRFTYGGRDWTLVPVGRIPKKAMKRMAKMAAEGQDNLEYMDEMLRAGMGNEQFAEFDELDIAMEDLENLFEDWSDHSGIEPGESSASSDS